MTTNINYIDKNFIPVDNAIVCHLTGVLSLNKMPELKNLINSPMVMKMLKKRHLTVTKDGGIIISAVGIAKFNKDDAKYDRTFGEHLSEDRATLKIINKAKSIFKWLEFKYIDWLEDSICENICRLGVASKNMEQHCEEISKAPNIQ